VTGEQEILQLQQRLKQLEKENEQLRLWKVRRMRVDRLASTHPLPFCGS
jgi:hypothetical protein